MKEPPDKLTSDEKAGEMMDYMDAKRNNVWKIERKLADDILESLKRNGVDDVFKLDNLTKGRGNCFMIATVQQLRREDVYEASRPEIRKIAATMDHSALRVSVYNWIWKNLTSPKIVRMRELYDLDQDIKRDLGEETKTWDGYWNYMLKDGTWADNWFVQACAMFLCMDYWIMDTTCTKEKPYFQIDGNLEDGEYCRETLCLGLAHESHYQSLLFNDEEEDRKDDEDFKDKEEMKTEKIKEDEDENIDEEQRKDDDYEDEVEKEDERSQDEDVNDEEDKKCPICKKQLKNVLLHIKKSKNCNSQISDAKLKEMELRSKLNRKEKVSQNTRNYRYKMDKVGLKNMQNEWKSASREKKRKHIDMKAEQNEREKDWKAASRKRQRDENY